MEPNSILAIIGSILSLVLLYLRRREDTKPKREDEEIDKTVASGDGKAIGSLIHGELNRMRNSDIKQ